MTEVLRDDAYEDMKKAKAHATRMGIYPEKEVYQSGM